MVRQLLKQVKDIKKGSKSYFIGLYLLPILFLLGGVTSIGLFGFQQWMELIIVFSFIILFLFVYLSIDHPEMLLFIVLLLNITYFPYKTATFIIIIFLCSVALFKYIQNNKFKFHFDIVTVLWLLMAALVILTIPKWKNLLNGLEGTIDLVLMPLLLYKVVTEGWLKQFTTSKMLTLYTPLLIIYLIIQVIIVIIFSKELPTLGSQINIMAYHSLDLIWGKSNYVAAILVYLVLVVVSAKNVLSKTVLNKIFINVIIIAGFLPVIMILSRGAILSFICGMAIYGILYRFLYVRQINIWNWIIMGCVATLVLSDYIFKLWQRFSQAKVDISTLIRFYIWKESLLKIKNNFIIGTGPKQNIFTDFNYMATNDPHNMFLRYGVDLGILAIIIIIIIIIMPLIKMGSLYKKKAKNINNIIILFVPSYIAAIINSQLEVVITSYVFGMIFWLFYALMWHNINLCQKEQNNDCVVL